MQFKVKDIGEGGLDVDVLVTASWLAAQCPDADVKTGPAGVSFRGRLERSGEDYLLRGRLGGSLTTTCSRCLEPATLPLEVVVEVIYVEEEKGRGEDDDRLDAPDVLHFDGGIVDLGPEIRDEILLALPVSVLCRPECAGLCPSCGGNRNLDPCDCAEREAARVSKLSVLAKFKT